MLVTAWNNGSHQHSGAGYGIKVTAEDRNEFFKREPQTVNLKLEGVDAPVSVNTHKVSFWDETCGELISKEIGKWLRENGLAPWPKGVPPKLRMEPLSEGVFFLRRPEA